MSRYAKRVDNNQLQIVELLRSLGFQVVHTHMFGEGFPDTIVAKNGKSRLVEIKDGQKAKLTPSQIKFINAWQGEKIIVLRNVDDVLKLQL